MLARFHAVLIGTLGMICLGGCGQADYEKCMENTEAKLKQAGKFSPLRLVPVNILETPLKIRLPAVLFDRGGLAIPAFTADGQGSSLKLEQIEPPFMILPGLKTTFQCSALEGGTQYPYFCYVGALLPGDTFTAPAPKPPAVEPKTDAPAEPPADAAPENKPAAQAENKSDAPTENKAEAGKDESAEKPVETPAAEPGQKTQPTVRQWIQDELAKAFPDQKEKPKWEPIDAPTPFLNEAPVHWERISVTGDQPFQIISNEVNDPIKYPGKFVLYMCERDGTTVLVAWRVPAALDASVPMEQWSLLSAGTLRQ